jgi:5-methylcytosine-specific restriction endonuclease McrA
METPPQKTCCGCHILKPLDEFGTDKYRPDGKATRCLLCKRQAGLIWRQTHLERARTQDRAAHRAQRAANPAKARAQAAAWIAANPEKRQLYLERDRPRQRARYAANPALTLARQRARQAADPEGFRIKKNAQARVRRAANPEQARAKYCAWLAANPEKRRGYERTRRALEREASINDLTDAQWLEIQTAFNFRCAYCPPTCWRCAKKRHKLTQDHISALGPEGPHTLHNVVPACRSCNSKKGKKAPLSPVQPLLLTVAPAKKPRK